MLIELVRGRTASIDPDALPSDRDADFSAARDALATLCADAPSARGDCFYHSRGHGTQFPQAVIPSGIRVSSKRSGLAASRASLPRLRLVDACRAKLILAVLALLSKQSVGLLATFAQSVFHDDPLACCCRLSVDRSSPSGSAYPAAAPLLDGSLSNISIDRPSLRIPARGLVTQPLPIPRSALRGIRHRLPISRTPRALPPRGNLFAPRPITARAAHRRAPRGDAP